MGWKFIIIGIIISWIGIFIQYSTITDYNLSALIKHLCGAGLGIVGLIIAFG